MTTCLVGKPRRRRGSRSDRFCVRERWGFEPASTPVRIWPVSCDDLIRQYPVLSLTLGWDVAPMWPRSSSEGSNLGRSGAWPAFSALFLS